MILHVKVGTEGAGGAGVSGSDQLRGRLRAETRPYHQRVDDAFSQFDVSRARDLAYFLGAQLAALQALVPQHGPDRAAAATIAADMSSAIAADLAALGTNSPPLLAPHKADATAVLYVLLGSRMGTQVLAHRWRLSADDEARGAGRYLGLDPQKDCWRALCRRLADRPAYGAAADAMISQVASIFDLYSAALAGVLASAKESAHV